MPPADRRVCVLAAVLAAALLTTGCASLAESVASHLASRKGSEIERVVSVLHSDAEAFRRCLETRGGACPQAATAAVGDAAAPAPRPLSTAVPDSLRASVEASYATGTPQRQGVDAAMAVLDHPVQERINGLFNQLRGCPDGGEPRVEVSVPQMADYADKLSTATALAGFDGLAAHAAELERKATAGVEGVAEDAEEAARRAAHSRTARYLAAYLRAYFENGRFVQLELDVDDLDERLRSSLARRWPSLCGAATAAAAEPSGERQAAGDLDPADVVTCDDLVAELERELFRGVATDPASGDFVFTKLGSDGYVGRGGDALRFPGFTVTLDPGGAEAVEVSKLDYTLVASDLVRVSLEAIFDAHEGLPAVSNATGVDLGKAGEEDALAVFQPTPAMSAADFGEVDVLSTRVEATVGAVVGRAIRGAGPIALNNDALADVLTTAVAVTVAKAGEKAAWCFYSCGLDTQLDDEGKRLGGAIRRATLKLVP